MKKKLFSLALCLGLTVPAFAAELKIVEVSAPAVVVEVEYAGKTYHVSNFREGLARLQTGAAGGAFVVDKTGKVVVPIGEYDTIWDFHEGMAQAIKDDKFGYIDATGKVVVPFRYPWAEVDSVRVRPLEDFYEGMVRVQKDGKYGFVDTTGEGVIPCKYDGAAAFSEGFAMVYNYYFDDRPSMPQNRPACGIIDKTGREIIPAGVYTEDGEEYILIWPGIDYVYFRDGRSDCLIKMCLSDDDKGGGTYFAITVDAEVSDWAREQVDLAAAKGLMPDVLGDDFTANITRAEFAAVAVELYEAMSGEDAPAPGESPFTDTNDSVVIQANALGIVNGKGDRVFAPADPVTRQEAALMLSRVYTKLGGEISKVESTIFADNDKVSSWAMDAVSFMSGKGIVNGVGENKFDPMGNASVEQALIIALRMFEKLEVE